MEGYFFTWKFTLLIATNFSRPFCKIYRNPSRTAQVAFTFAFRQINKNDRAVILYEFTAGQE